MRRPGGPYLPILRILPLSLLLYTVVLCAAELPVPVPAPDEALAPSRREPGAGFFLAGTERGPRLETHLCGADAMRPGGQFYFFNKKKELCQRSVTYHPAAVAIRLPRTAAPVSTELPWRLVDGEESILLYDPGAKFGELSDEEGRVLVEDEYGVLFDATGAVAAPRFLFRNGSWGPVVPLRELFLLQVQADRSFSVEVRSAADLSGAAADIASFFGLSADRIVLRSPGPHRATITGGGFSDMRIPALVTDGTADRFGRYRIEMRKSGPDRKGKKVRRAELKFAAGAAVAETTPNGSFTLEIAITRSAMKPEEEHKLRLFIQQNLPRSYAEEK
ncbi:MAG TPA: hypothetical protein P5077_07065 [bacterium]|nr:hypothetical protein [bacterium]